LAAGISKDNKTSHTEETHTRRLLERKFNGGLNLSFLIFFFIVQKGDNLTT
jgi:hypothetical protein